MRSPKYSPTLFHPKTLRLISLVAALVSALPVLPGCAITVNLPVNRFETPESQGERTIDLEAGVQGAHKLVLVPNSTATGVPQLDAPFFQHVGSTAMGGVGIGLVNGVDISVRGQVNTPSLLKVKVQLLGPPAAEPRPGAFSLAVSGGFGFGRKTEVDEDPFSSITAESQTTFNTYDASLIAGVRLSRSTLLYSSVYRTLITVDGDIRQTGPSIPMFIDYAYGKTARQTGGTLGIEVRSHHLGGMIEIGYGSAEYQSAETSNLFFGAVFKLYGGNKD